MGFFSWLGSLFGGKKKTKIPSKVVEYRNRPSGAVRSPSAPPERTYERARQEDVAPPQQSGGMRDMFELAGDRAQKAKEEAARTVPPPPPPPDTGFAGAPAFTQQQETPAAEPESAPPQPGDAPPPVEDDYSPLDLARELQGAPPTGSQATSEPVFDPDAAYKTVPAEQPDATEEASDAAVADGEPVESTFEIGSSEGDSKAELESLGVTFETGYAEPETTVTAPESEPAIVTTPEPEPPVEAATPEPEPKPAPTPPPAAQPAEDDPDARMLDRLKDQTVEGSGTVTIERRRIETKSINIGGENFEIAIYEYQNGTRAARVPRAAIERMTEIAKQNNLKVLPRKQNAAIMAGRFLGVARAELQERAEKEKYHLVDFTDIYYEICFGELPE